jgi:hypothetical protein
MTQSVSHVLTPFVYRRKIGGLCLHTEVTLFVPQGETSYRQALYGAARSSAAGVND